MSYQSIYPAYEPLQRDVNFGQDVVTTAEVLVVECPLTGVPGPDIIFWQRGQTSNSPK